MGVSIQYTTTRATRRRTAGVTLVELMIALVISSIVLIGVGTVYFSSKRAYLIQEEYARMQENARFAFHFLTQDIRQAGYAGCNPVVHNLLDVDNENAGLYDFNSAIYGWEFTGTAPGDDDAFDLTGAPAAANKWKDNSATSVDLHDEISGDALAGSDVIVTKAASEIPGLELADDPFVTDAGGVPQVVLSSNHDIPKGQIVMLSDCRAADLFQNNKNPPDTNLSRPAGASGFQPGNKPPGSTDWDHVYTKSDSRILTTSSRAYFIGEGASGEPALFRIDYDEGDTGLTAEELVEGVENMQVAYGLDRLSNTTFEATRYVPFDQVDDINDVVAVRISLLMRTPAQLDRPDDTKTYSLLSVDPDVDVEINPIDDRRLRKVFTTTIALRNKMVAGRGVSP